MVRGNILINGTVEIMLVLSHLQGFSGSPGNHQVALEINHKHPGNHESITKTLKFSLIFIVFKRF